MHDSCVNPAIGSQILELDVKRVAAMVARDVGTLAPLLADDLTYTHSGGYTDTKVSLLTFIGEQGNYEGVDFLDAHATVLSAEAVVVRGLARIRLTGIPGYEVIFVDLWTRTTAGWQMRAWQATRKKI